MKKVFIIVFNTNKCIIFTSVKDKYAYFKKHLRFLSRITDEYNINVNSDNDIKSFLNKKGLEEYIEVTYKYSVLCYNEEGERKATFLIPDNIEFGVLNQINDFCKTNLKFTPSFSVMPISQFIIMLDNIIDNIHNEKIRTLLNSTVVDNDFIKGIIKNNNNWPYHYIQVTNYLKKPNEKV